MKHSRGVIIIRDVCQAGFVGLTSAVVKGLKRRSRLAAILLWSIGIVAAPALVERADAQPSPPETDSAKIAGSMAKFGITMFVGLGAEFNASTLPNPTFSSTDVQKDISLLVEKYHAEMQAGQATADFSKASGEFLITGLTFIGTLSGVGAVPSAIIGAGANWANDNVAATIRKSGEETAQQFLYESLKKWDDNQGVSYENVKAMLDAEKFDEASRSFDNATGMLTRLRKELKDDPAGQRAVEDFLWKIMKQTTRVNLEQTGANTQEIRLVEKDLANQVKFSREFAKRTADRLEDHAKKLTDLDNALQKASNDIHDLQEAQGTTAKQVGLIQNIIFGQASAATKVLLLESGMPGLSDSQRRKLISYYKTEQSKQELLQSAAQIVSSAREIQGIFANLGFQDPRLNQVVAYANVAQAALSQALSGNYLAAFASVTSVFGGGKPDPEQERFNVLMGFLQEKFTQIIQLQVKTLEAIQALSKQLADLDKRLNERLDNIDFEVKTISLNLQAHMWQDYKVCNTAWEEKDSVQFDDDRLQFLTFDYLQMYLDKYYLDAVKCAQNLDDLFGQIKTKDVFGPLLSLSAAVSKPFDLLDAEKEKKSALTQPDLKRFLEELHKPARQVVLAGWKTNWGAQANAVGLLSSPSPTTIELKERFKSLAGLEKSMKPLLACSTPTLLTWRMRSLLCAEGRYASDQPSDKLIPNDEQRALERTAAFLSDPIVRDQLPWLAKWTGLVARPYDFANKSGTGKDRYSVRDLVEGKGTPRGKDLIWGMLSVIDIAIAQQTMLHGDLTAKFIYDDVRDRAKNMPRQETAETKEPELSAIRLLKNSNNPWLQRNVLMLAIEDSLRQIAGDPSLPYEQALKPFLEIKDATKSSPEDLERIQIGTLFLKDMFNVPTDVKFLAEDVVAGNQMPVRKVFIEWGGYKIEMPSVQAIRNRALIYPPSINNLLRIRALMVERFLDYILLEKLGPEQKDRVAQTLLFGLAKTTK